eukprot:6048557-Pleurochrysis_carterae.AAC.1
MTRASVCEHARVYVHARTCPHRPTRHADARLLTHARARLLAHAHAHAHSHTATVCKARALETTFQLYPFNDRVGRACIGRSVCCFVRLQELQDLKDAIIEAGIDQGVTLSGMDCSCARTPNSRTAHQL